jgi:hypothetical protein
VLDHLLPQLRLRGGALGDGVPLSLNHKSVTPGVQSPMLVITKNTNLIAHRR